MRFPFYSCALILTTTLVIFSLLSLSLGAMSLPADESLLSVVDYFSGSQYSQLQTYQEAIIIELRLPRLLLAIAVGAILAQCGAVMQGLFRNPLADPGIIGVSAGAAIGAVIAIAFFPNEMKIWAVPLLAFLGGLISTLLVYALAQSKQGTSILVLLLAGIAISSFAGAGIGFMSYFTDDQKLRELSLWQMGSLNGANDTNLLLAFITLAILSYCFRRKSTALNALLLGEAEARHLGIAVEKLKLELIILTAIGVGIAVSAAGVIGFVGLVIPHFIRIISGPNHHSLLPLSALCGALLLVIGDLSARLLVQPAELPVGLVTALLGAPFFILLLIQQRKHIL